MTSPAGIDVTYDPRTAGQVTRYHTWPRIRDQSVGEHTWQVMRILLTVWPTCPRKMLVYCHMHDRGEMAADIAYPFKKKVPELGAGSKIAEKMIMVEQDTQWGGLDIPVLSEYEEDVFKCCEYLEMWEYGLCEINMGNRYGVLISERCILEASARLERLRNPPAGCPNIVEDIKRYQMKRMKQESGANG